jgi:hypothetical protein
LSEDEIMRWARAFHSREGYWPTLHSGPIADTFGETWSAVNSSLSSGSRGLSGGSSLARLLAAQGVERSQSERSPLTIEEILEWADAAHRRDGCWPTERSGPIEGAPGETWRRIARALQNGTRGLPGRSSLARLLVEHRGARSRRPSAPLTVERLLEWADSYREREGRWPTRNSGPVAGVPEESWNALDRALHYGYRGLPSQSSLARLLAAHRDVRNRKALPKLTIEEILAAADAHYGRHGTLPDLHAGPIEDLRRETWSGVNSALHIGGRGLPGGLTLVRLFKKHRRDRFTGRSARSYHRRARDQAA